jgi:hypothetical protein
MAAFSPWLRRALGGSRRRPVELRRVPRLEWLEARHAPAIAFVTTDADVGAGSFRDAIDQANNNAAIDTIIIKNVPTINLASSLTYTGAQNLTIKGNGATISGDQTFDLLVSEGNADLSLDKLTFRNGVRGVYVPLSADATGTVSVSLTKVTLENNQSHGLHIDDQTIGSDASVHLTVRHTTVADNGTETTDRDGIRVDEGGLGSIVADIDHTTVSGNGGDGMELDERGDGSAELRVDHADFLGNGFLDPADFDDGVDIDEADAGDIRVQADHVRFKNNFEEGLDLNEAGAGDLAVQLDHVEVIGNGEEGIDVEEFGEGNVSVAFAHVLANGNGREGIDLKERDNGSLLASLCFITTNDNTSDGVKADETGDGDLNIAINHLLATNNGERGINLDEAGGGVLVVDLAHIVSGNPLADDVT